MDIAQRQDLLVLTAGFIVTGTFIFLALYFHNPKPDLYLDLNNEPVDDDVWQWIKLKKTGTIKILQ